ncbi:MAG: hydantoinase B/oxoprolinase family protein [Chloroflexota bacterium]|nr:hydantoinase B/oxoprolinase family protein [Chloroflexota bacterium]
MVDPITAEIVRNYMETVAAEIIKTMVRSSVNPIFNEAHDCSAGVFYYDGEQVSLIARGDAVPVHIYAALTSVEEALRFFHGDLNDGDIIIVCDPYYGGTHIGDYTVVKPVFYKGKPIFFPSVRAHVLDTGGPIPGGFNLSAREVWQEGFRYAPMKLYDKGDLRREVWDWLQANNRLPDILEADLNAMIGGCRVGEQRIRTLTEKYGFETVRESIEWIFDYSEGEFRREIASWPDGEYTAESVLDTDYAGTYDVAIKAKITIEGDEILVDFTGTSPQSPCIINSVPGNTLSYVYGVFSALCPDIPINSGFFRPVKAIMPEGSVVNPRPPAPAAYATICIGCDIGDALMKACEQFVPERVGTASIDLVIFWSHGVDARNNRFFIQYDYHASPISSSGAYGVDGWGAWSALFCALKLASIEMTEIQYPVLYHQGEYTTDSAAPGQWRGAPAYAMQREPHNSLGPIHLNIWIQGLVNSLHGFCGGHPGAGNYAILGYGSDREQVVTEVAFLHPSPPGDVVFFQSSGGGGWGNPLDRDPAMVLDDVKNEYVSVEGALRDYGVVIEPDQMEVDLAATERTRARLRAESSAHPQLALGRERTVRSAGVHERVQERLALAAV